MHAVQLQTNAAAGSADELNILDNPTELQATGRLAGQSNTKRLTDLGKLNRRARERHREVAAL
jgi:hypothetical protein